MSLHLCHVFPTFSPGGAELRTVDLMNEGPLSTRHSVVSLDGYTGCASRVRHDCRMELVGAGPRRRFSWRPRSLGSVLRGIGADLWITYNWGSTDAVVAVRLRGLRPWIHVMDGFGAEESRGELLSRRIVRRLLYPRADAVVVVSTGLARLARESWKVPESRLFHIPNGIDLDRFSPGSAGEFRRTLGIGPEDLLVGSVAHLRPEKNAPRLLEAFLEVAPRHPRAHLVFVGWIPSEADGSEARQVRRMRDRIRAASLDARVHFAGKAQDTVPCYRALDLFALASDSEQMPLSLMEAMGCGLAVLSTDVGDAKEMLPEANRPFVTPLDDDAAYARALDRLLSDAPLRASLGGANRARALARFGRGRMVADYYRLFGSLASGAIGG